MPHLDKFLSALLANNATALLLKADDVAVFDVAGVPRPVTKQPFTAAQLTAMILEVAPAPLHPQIEAGNDMAFAYRAADRTFDARVGLAGGTDGGELPCAERARHRHRQRLGNGSATARLGRAAGAAGDRAGRRRGGDPRQRRLRARRRLPARRDRRAAHAPQHRRAAATSICASASRRSFAATAR